MNIIKQVIHFFKPKKKVVNLSPHNHKSKKKDNRVRVFFAQQTDNTQMYEVYLEGKGTKHMVTVNEIKLMLDKKQFERFKAGELVFFIPEKEVFAHSPLYGKKVTLKDFKGPDRYYE